MQAIIFCGIQASGKSSFYRERFFNSHVRISLDLLRTRHRERLFLETCLKSQMRFVVDNTNPTREERSRYIRMAREAKYEVVGYFFEASSEEAVKRNSRRAGRFLIPVKGIYGTQKRLEVPTLGEGFDKLYQVRLMPWGAFEVRQAEEQGGS
ncbi:AAA family ATPase [Pontibacter litorisediminis]|uniref:AAA family ATPase n=1 Tax=Pontibacter litorisediminis TaxID=1846260 RepID=UPI0023EBF8A3|nr:AAA family ATPase [Pontibacter litorisediminis]